MAQNPWSLGGLAIVAAVAAAIVVLGIANLMRVGSFFTSLSARQATSYATSCRDQAHTFLSDVGALRSEWDDADDLASQTPRVALPSQIQGLRAVRQKAEDLGPPDCALMVKHQLIDAMDTTIDGYVAYLGQKEADARQYLARGQHSMDGVAQAIAALE